MRVSNQQVARAVSLLLDEKKGSEESIFRDLLVFLRRKNMLRRSGKIAEELEKAINLKEGRLPVMVTTARALTETERKGVREEVTKLFSDTKPDLSFREDPKLIGGVRIETDNTRYDYSLSRSLRLLAQSLRTHV